MKLLRCEPSSGLGRLVNGEQVVSGKRHTESYMPANDEFHRVDVILAMSLRSDGGLNPDDPTYDWRFLADGDSWFTIGAIPSSNLLCVRITERCQAD